MRYSGKKPTENCENEPNVEELLDLVRLMAKEISSELDLHYDDDDLFALAPTINIVKHAKNVLEQNAVVVPEAVIHILKRFHRFHN